MGQGYFGSRGAVKTPAKNPQIVPKTNPKKGLKRNFLAFFGFFWSFGIFSALLF